MSELELKLAGERFTGWKRVTVTRSLEQIAATFSLEVAGTWLVGRRTPVEGEACEIIVDGATLLTGYVDSTVVGYSAREHTLTVQGRSKLGDLVDCAAVVAGGQFHNQSLEQIAESLCSPFGIGVVSERLARPAFRRFSVQEGESCIEALGRAARANGVLLVSDDLGNLVITSGLALSAVTPLQLGVNILSGRREGSLAECFSTYTVLCQQSGDDSWLGRSAAQVSGSASDTTVARYRPFRMVADSQINRSGAAQRASWERNTRSAAAVRYTYSVPGWHDGDGFWAPNTLVAVSDETFGLSTQLLAAVVTMTKGDQGELTELELVHPDAYDVAKTPIKERNEYKPWESTL